MADNGWSFQPVEGDPFAAKPAWSFQPVEGDPFAPKQLPMAKQDEGSYQPPPAPDAPPTAEKMAIEDRMTPKVPTEGASPVQPSAPPVNFQQDDTRLGRIGSAIADAWKNSPTVLTPKAQAWLDKTGLGGVTRLADLALAAPNAVFAGGEQAAVELGAAAGLPQTGRGVAEAGEFLTGPGMVLFGGAPSEAPREAAVPHDTPSATPTLDAVAAEAHAGTQTPTPPAAMHTPEQAAIAELDNIATGKPAATPAPEPPVPAATEPPVPPEPKAAPEVAALEQRIAEAPSEGLKPVYNADGQWIGYEREQPTPPAAEPPATEPVPPTPESVPEVAESRHEEPDPSSPEAQPESPPRKGRQAAPTPFDAVPKEPMRLIEWLRRPTVQSAGTIHETTIPGGIIDEGGDLKAILGGSRGRPGLINKNGRSLDDAAEAAWEAGYLPGAERPTINDLKDAIRDDHNGIPRYSEHDADDVAAYRDAHERNQELDRLGTQYGIPTANITRDEFYDRLHDAMSLEERGAEALAQYEAEEAAYAEAERQAKQWVAEHPHEEGVASGDWEAQHFYGQSQGRTLEDLEREYQQEAAAPEARERQEGSEQPGPAGADQGAIPEGNAPLGRGAGAAGRGEAEGPAKDLLGRPVAEPQAPRAAAEPTIRNDERQIGLPGTEASAVQAQAARDAGRGTLHGDVTQKPANEGLFAPDMSGQGSLYSFPGMLFDPAIYKRALGPLREALNKPKPGYELLRDKEGMRRAAAEIRAGLAPTSMRGAKPMEYAIRRHNAESAQAYDQSLDALEKVRAAVDKLPVQAQVDFTNRMETGQAQPTPELQAVATALRSQLDGWAKKIQGLGKGYLADAIENYMGHIWGNYAEWAARRDIEHSQPEMQAIATAKNVRRQPLRGSGAFLKQRSFPTQLEGINAGLVPVTTNPVDLQLIKLHEMQKFYHGTVLADQIKQQGMAKWVPASAEAEHDARLSGWVPLDDTIFKPRMMGQNNQAGFGRLEPGSYWAPEPLARVFNNYMSQGWHGKSAIYDGIRRGNNALNSLQLGFSGFHLAFVTADTAISRAALGLQQITQGRPLIGAKNIAEGATILPSAVHTLYSGSQLRKAWLDPANATPAMQKIVEAMKAGGMRVSMPDFFRSSTAGSFFRSFHDLKNPMSPFHQVGQMFADAKGPVEKAVLVPARVAMRAMDTIQQPLMGYLVPRMKLGVFSDMAKNWLDQHPNASQAELSAAMTKMQDSVDNRLGQLQYDNLFWSKTAKDLAFITTRSVGWNLGTIREIGGGFVDTASALRDIASGKLPKLTERMAYTIMLPLITAEIGAIKTYIATGQPPQHRDDDLAGAIPLDYFYPPNGPPDANGHVDRSSIPGYMKDVVAAGNETYRNYEHGKLPIPAQTVLNKTAPLFETAQELLKNQDYYGGIIYDPLRDKGRLPAYGDYLLNQMAPFTLRSQNKLQDQGASSLDQALGWFGFQPAPKSIVSPSRGERYQLRQDRNEYRARQKEPGRINVFNAP